MSVSWSIFINSYFGKGLKSVYSLNPYFSENALFHSHLNNNQAWYIILSQYLLSLSISKIFSYPIESIFVNRSLLSV